MELGKGVDFDGNITSSFNFENRLWGTRGTDKGSIGSIKDENGSAFFANGNNGFQLFFCSCCSSRVAVLCCCCRRSCCCSSQDGIIGGVSVYYQLWYMQGHELLLVVLCEWLTWVNKDKQYQLWVRQHSLGRIRCLHYKACRQYYCIVLSLDQCLQSVPSWHW